MFVVEATPTSFDVEEKKIANISNCITFKKSTIQEDGLYRYFAKSRKRLQCVSSSIHKGMDVIDAFRVLRSHSSKHYFNGSVGSVCMHAGKMIGDHTTSSMVVELLPNKIDVYVTMGSCPCISLFKKWTFGEKRVYPIVEGEVNEHYYRTMERIKRRMKNLDIPDDFYQKRNALENKIVLGDYSFSNSLKEETKLYEEISSYKKIRKDSYYWKKKNKIYEEESSC